MAISFPSNPSVDDVYSYNGVGYVWDGVKWISGRGSQTLDSLYLKAGDNVSELTNDSGYLGSGGNVSELTNDSGYLGSGANVSDLTNDSGFGYTGGRNVIDNPEMLLAQRGVIETGLDDGPAYLVDRWSYRRSRNFSMDNISFQMEQEVISGDELPGFKNFLRLENTSFMYTNLPLSSQYFLCIQPTHRGQCSQPVQ